MKGTQKLVLSVVGVALWGSGAAANGNLVGFTSHAAHEHSKLCDHGFMPPNNLHLRDNRFAPSNITREQFDQIVDEVVALWQPLALARGVTLEGIKDWDNSDVNAEASREGNAWRIRMFGGLARRPEVTADAFTLVVCHELGHHFGGFAFKTPTHYAANEGQSDYFATQACARRVWGRDRHANQSFPAMADVPATVLRKCREVWGNDVNAEGLCIRSAAASQALGNLLAANSTTKPSFDTPDPNVVPATSPYHPKAQCRLDTYFSGALCAKAFDLSVIPGLNHPAGQTSLQAELDASRYSCTERNGDRMGVRPRCWFRPGE